MIDQLKKLLADICVDTHTFNAHTHWDSLVINRRKPHTYRIFKQYGDYRVCLHKFEPCEEHEAFGHPHPWAGAFLVLKGECTQYIGLSTSDTGPVWCYKELIRPGTMYEITKPMTWHRIQPLKTTWTVMINREPWRYPHVDVKTTKGKDLEKMDDKSKKEHLSTFYMLINKHLQTYSKGDYSFRYVD